MASIRQTWTGLPKRVGFRHTGCAALALLVLVPGLLGARSGDGAIVSRPAKSSADAIIVLGGAFTERFPKALELLRAGAAKRMVIDADDVQKTYGQTAADRAIEIARQEGALADNIDVCRVTADSTDEEALQVGSCLKTIDAESAMIVTSDYHNKRALAVFKHELPQFDWSIPMRDGQSAVNNNATFAIRFQELAKILWWQGVDRWQSVAQTEAVLAHTRS